jgi:lysozyme family protein
MSLDIQTAIVNRILKREGGVGTDDRDRGGRTLWGQTADWLEEYGLPEPTEITQAAANYLTWLSKTRLDELCTVDDALADVTIDAAVNTGTYRAIRSLQAALGTRPDGAIGAQTIEALDRCDRGAVAAQVWRDHLMTCVATVTNDRALVPLVATTQLAFLRGWVTRCAGQVTRLN